MLVAYVLEMPHMDVIDVKHTVESRHSVFLGQRGKIPYGENSVMERMSKLHCIQIFKDLPLWYWRNKAWTRPILCKATYLAHRNLSNSQQLFVHRLRTMIFLRLNSWCHEEELRQYSHSCLSRETETETGKCRWRKEWKVKNLFFKHMVDVADL